MSPFDVAVYVVAGAAVLTALAAMLTLRSLRQAEREIAERDRAQHAAE